MDSELSNLGSRDWMIERLSDGCSIVVIDPLFYGLPGALHGPRYLESNS